MLEQKYQDELATSPQHYSSSPMGPLTDSASRRLLIDLISTMNASFPDYDFRCVCVCSGVCGFLGLRFIGDFGLFGTCSLGGLAAR